MPKKTNEPSPLSLVPKKRHLIVVDTETTGLHENAAILEVAAINLDTGEELQFVPYLSREDLRHAQPLALEINRYFERGVWRHQLSDTRTEMAYRELADMLKGNTLAGSNPTFDAQLLAKVMPASWHHRLADLATYTAGKLNLDPCELPGLDAVCDRLGVLNENPHTALGDARATAACFAILRETPAAIL